MPPRIVALSALLLAAGACGPPGDERRENPAAGREGGALLVARVVDGDTLALANGDRVRLVQIDAPEVDESECYGREAAAALRAILPPGTRVRLRGDPRLDDADRYGRLLRYVFKGRENVNLVLVRRGAASVWFYEGERGRYAGELLAAARRAKAERRGLWRECPGAELAPLEPVATG